MITTRVSASVEQVIMTMDSSMSVKPAQPVVQSVWTEERPIALPATKKCTDKSPPIVHVCVLLAISKWTSLPNFASNVTIHVKLVLVQVNVILAVQ